MEWLRVKLTTTWLQVRRPNHYTTEPPRMLFRNSATAVFSSVCSCSVYIFESCLWYRPKDWLCARQGWFYAHVWPSFLWWQWNRWSSSIYLSSFIEGYFFPLLGVVFIFLDVQNVALNPTYFVTQADISICFNSLTPCMIVITDCC